MADCAAEAAEAKTSVWWDIDWCAVPTGCCDPHRIAHNVIAALAAAGRKGPVSFFAYGDASRIAPGVLEALSATGIPLNHVSAGAKDGVDKKMLVDMVFWAYDNPPPGNYLLISGDRDFSDLLHRLMMKKYEILLAQPQNASSRALVTAAKTVWLWESLAAGKLVLAESPHSHSVPDCNRNSNNVDVSNCSHSKAHAVHAKSDCNVKAGVKPLQKYVKKSNITSSFATNQGQLESVVGVSKDSTGSTVSELERSSVSSSSSSESIDGAKVDQSSLLGTPTLSQLSAQKPEVSAHLHPMEISRGFNRGEEPIRSTKCAPRNGTRGVSNVYYHQMYQQSKYDSNGKGGNECKVKPLQKYVKKTSITSSSGNQVDSVGAYDCFNETTRNELHLSTALSSSSKSLEGESPPGISTLLQSPAQKPAASHLHQMRESHKSILGKKPSTLTAHTSRDGNNDLGVSIGHHPTYQHQSQSSQAQNKHSNFNVGNNSGKSGNQYKVKQHQQYLKKTNILSSSASSETYLGFSGNSKGSILGHPSRSMSSSPCSESLGGTEANPLSPLTSVGAKPVMPTDLHQVGADFIFGKKPSTSVECMPKNGTFCFGASDGHYDPTYQLTQSSMLLKQDNPGPHCRSAFGQPCSITTDVDSSVLPSAGNNGFPSSQRKTWPSGSTFQDLADICSGISKLTISECPQGTGDARPLSVAPSVSGHPRGVHEIGSSPHPSPNISFHPNHSNAYPSVQPPPGDNTCRPPTPNLSCNIQNPGNNGETQGSPPNSSKPEGTIRTVLHALDILKTEKMYPTESNIADCICYGEMNFPGFDVKKALELSMRHQAVIMKKLVNDMPLFVAKDESLWKCVDVTNSNAKRPKALETVRKFLSSLGGHSAIKNSESRYQAATILRKFCLQQHALGDVLQILHIIIVRKKWLVPHSSGWQPLCFNTIVIDAASDAIGEVTS